jgi:ferritin-like metal-binding protein YciE
MENLNELFEEMLKDVYFAEKTIVKALPKLSKHATSPALKLGFDNHLAETTEQVKRLEQIFHALDLKAEAKECPAILGLMEEAKELMGEVQPSPLLDAGLAAHARAVEHYEIARYTALHEWSGVMGMTEVSTLLEATLAEEVACDKALTKLAKSELNETAAGEAPGAKPTGRPALKAVGSDTPPSTSQGRGDKKKTA